MDPINANQLIQYLPSKNSCSTLFIQWHFLIIQPWEPKATNPQETKVLLGDNDG